MRTVLSNCRVVDGTGQPAVERAAFIIEGERIIWCGAESDRGRPAREPGDAVVDLGGMTVLPGLFNVHVHLGLRLPFPERRADPFPPGYRVMLNYRRALEAILTGTTNLRIVGEPHFSDIDVREAIDRGLLPGPRIKAAGHALIATGGHGHNSVGCIEADGPDGFRRAAREQLRAGADLVKICLTGGIGTPREQPQDKQMSDDEVRAVVEVAHGAGKRVASHTGGNKAIQDAVRLGVDCIEHGYSFEDETAAMMAKAGTYLVPTLCVTQELDYMRRHGVQEWMLAKAKAAAGEHLASIRRAVIELRTLQRQVERLDNRGVGRSPPPSLPVHLLVGVGHEGDETGKQEHPFDQFGVEPHVHADRPDRPRAVQVDPPSPELFRGRLDRSGHGHVAPGDAVRVGEFQQAGGARVDDVLRVMVTRQPLPALARLSGHPARRLLHREALPLHALQRGLEQFRRPVGGAVEGADRQHAPGDSDVQRHAAGSDEAGGG